MRDHEWLLKGQQPAHDQRFEEEGIGHPVDAGRTEVRIEERPLRVRRERGALDLQRFLRRRESGFKTASRAAAGQRELRVGGDV